MDRRSALLAATGVVIGIVVAVAAIVAGVVGPDPATADVAARERPPHVRTITRTVTVHQPGGSVTVPGVSIADGDADDRAFTERADGEHEGAVSDDGHDDDADEDRPNEHEGDVADLED